MDSATPKKYSTLSFIPRFRSSPAIFLFFSSFFFFNPKITSFSLYIAQPLCPWQTPIYLTHKVLTESVKDPGDKMKSSVFSSLGINILTWMLS